MPIEKLYIEKERMKELAEEHAFISENYWREVVGIEKIIAKKERGEKQWSVKLKSM